MDWELSAGSTKKTKNQSKACGECSNDPEAHNDVRFRPSFLFEVVMDWGNEEYFFAEQFFGCDLDDDRKGFDNENETNEGKNRN